jgi:hypothetical protein
LGQARLDRDRVREKLSAAHALPAVALHLTEAADYRREVENRHKL